MQRTLMTVLGLTLAAASLQGIHAQDGGLPKVDFQIGQIRPVGQGYSIEVTNRGFATSPNTVVMVAIYDQQRRLIKTESLNVTPLQPNASRRVIFVPPTPGQPISVRATVDPGNRVPETNEGNNQIAGRL